MKFSTGSSSSSLASDSLSRKSTLCIYADVDTLNHPPHCERMDSSSEAMELRRELEAVKSALQQQSESVLKQRHQLVEASQALSVREKRAVQERRLRHDQLALVLRSLVLLESRLTREQNQIQVELKQKEKIIKIQQEEITNLKARKTYCSNCQQILGFTSEQTNIETDPEFQSLESTDSRFQNSFVRSCSYRERTSQSAFQKNTRLSKSFQLPKHDVVYGNSSSSEEGNHGKISFIKNKQAFVRRDVFRRSRKYSSRKQNSKCLENIQKANKNQMNNSSSAEECVGMNYQVNENNDITSNRIVHDIRKASKKIDQLIDETTKKESDSILMESDNTYSSKIERLHGIKRQGSDEIKASRQIFLSNVLSEDNSEKPWYCNASDQEHESDNHDNRNQIIKVKSTESHSLTNFQEATNVNTSKNIPMYNKETESYKNQSSKIGKISPANNQTTENWYASASDVDDCPSNEIYKNNPVLECVNQILLQNSLDDSSNDNSKSSEAPSPKTSAKRVQFSTLNSISYDDIHRNTLPRPDRRANKIVKFSLETASEHSYEVPNTAQGYQYEIQSVYSNDYEPITTKAIEPPRPLPRNIIIETPSLPNVRGSIVKNLAANIENRNSSDRQDGSTKVFNKRKVPRTPPALPPKPKNLSNKWKTESNTVKPQTESLDSEAVAANQRVADVNTINVGQVATESLVEPDYCSISEINVPVVSNGKRELLLTQPTVEIHNEQYPVHTINQRNNIAKVVSLPRIQTKISDKDIPKLPQVTEIIIPDEDEKPAVDVVTSSFQNNFIPTPNKGFLVNSIPPKSDARGSIQMGTTVSSILSEINRGGKVSGKQISLVELDQQYKSPEKCPPENVERHKDEYFEEIDKFDLSQNFEEFKIDDDLGSLVAEEYRISSGSSDGSASDVVIEHDTTSVPEKEVENGNVKESKSFEEKTFLDEDEKIVDTASTNSSLLSNKPDLLSNIENLETESVRNTSDIESSNSSGSNSGSYNTVKCEPGMVPNKKENVVKSNHRVSFDFFLETSGLSSKSLMTPSKNYHGMRPQSANHKNVLKPRDIKMRYKNPIATNKVNDKTMTTAIKYFEPYL